MGVQILKSVWMQPTVVRVYAVRTCGIVKVQLHSFLALALDEGEWLASCYGRLILGKIAPFPLSVYVK